MKAVVALLAVALAVFATRGASAAEEACAGGSGGEGGERAACDTPDGFGAWAGTSYGTYLAPRGEIVDEQGRFDVVFHFHAAHLAERAWRSSGLKAVVVSVAFGVGSSVYAREMADPSRFERMLAELERRVRARTKRRDARVGRVALVGWSAGVAAVQAVLATPRGRARVDAVVLLDGMFAALRAQPGPRHADAKSLGPLLTFARDAVAEDKLMVVTHAEVPGSTHASTEEAATALLEELRVTPVPTERARVAGLTERLHADSGALHVCGFAGQTSTEHLAQLQFVGEAVRAWLVPRWSAPAHGI
jgi:hypothetical protein